MIWLMFFMIAILGMVVWIIMLIDCLKRKFPSDNEKIAWVLVLVLTHWIGVILYYFLVKRKDAK